MTFSARVQPARFRNRPYLSRRWFFFCFALFLMIGSVGTAQTAPSPTIALPVALPVDLARDWKVQTGDDPAWAQPGFDDSGWTKTGIADAWASPAHDGFSWYRREVRLPLPALSGSSETLGIRLGQVEYGAYQIFANGREIGRFGDFQPSANLPRARPAAFSLPEGTVGPDGRLMLAIRLWKKPAFSRPAAFYSARYEPWRKTFAVGRFDVLRDDIALEYRDRQVADLGRLIMVVIFFAGSLYHVLLFLGRRNVTEYLWFGFTGIGGAVNVFCNSFWVNEFLSIFAADAVKVLAGQLTTLLMTEFISRFVNRPIPGWVRGIQAIQVLSVLMIAIWPTAVTTPIRPGLVFLILPVVTIQAVITFQEMRRGHPDAWPFVVGFGIFLVTQSLTIAMVFGWLNIPQLYHWGLAAIVLSMAIALSQRFNRVYRDLDALNRDLENKVEKRTEALSLANGELAETVTKLEEAQAETVRKNEELDRKISELNHKNRELVVAQQQADRIFSALALALPGTVLDEKYRLDEKIGEGGFGIVFKATHLALGRVIAVKVFKPRAGNDNAEAIERFKREGISISRLNHPNIISVLDSGISAQGIAYLVMELLKGISLADEMRGGGLTCVRHCVSRILPVCRALAEAHRLGIIHRDIKPDNIFIDVFPEGEIVKVVDFGIAKMVADDTSEELEKLTATDSIIGTPVYMSPERISGKSYDGRSDVYSVGVVLYEMLAGRPPFEKSTSGLVGIMMSHLHDAPPFLRELNPLIPPVFEDIINRTLEKNPANRPSARELADLLVVALETLPPDVADTSFDRRAPREAFIPTVHSSFSSL